VQSSPFEPAVAPLYAGLVRRLVLVLGDADEAQDIAQDAYLQAFRAWGRFDGFRRQGWLYTIALRLAFNQMRRRRRWLAAIRRVDPKPWRDPADPDLWAALQDLDPRTRSALLLNVVDGYTQVEIAEMLSVRWARSAAGSPADGRGCARLSLRPPKDPTGLTDLLKSTRAAHRTDVALDPTDPRGPSIRCRLARGPGQVERQKPSEQLLAVEIGRPVVSGQDGRVGERRGRLRAQVGRSL